MRQINTKNPDDDNEDTLNFCKILHNNTAQSNNQICKTSRFEAKLLIAIVAYLIAYTWKNIGS